jgi:K+-sensing histidine kinase KdpD
VALVTDPRRLRQILLNLLSNAAKFGAGAPVRVACTRLPHGAPPPGRAVGRPWRERGGAEGAIVVSVTDQGPGIAPADQERIFEEFVQLPGGAAGGTGLGLPISRRLAELLGGALTLESAPGEGSTFHLVLPGDAPTARHLTGDPSGATSRVAVRTMDDTTTGELAVATTVEAERAALRTNGGAGREAGPAACEATGPEQGT